MNDSSVTRARPEPNGGGEDEPPRVLVAGAGPAGLTAAYELVQAGLEPIVFEKDDIVGGHARTSRYKGYRFDMGGHRFFTKIRRVERIWEEIMGDDMLHVPRLSRIYYNGAFFQYPLQLMNVLRGLGVWNSFRIGVSYLYALVFPYRQEDNFEQWVVNRFGRRLFETFFRSYTEKVWGIPCAQIGADWAAQRIKGLSMRKAVMHALLGDRSNKVKTLIDRFRYPRLGPGQLWERMAGRIDEMGGAVMMERPVEAILRDGRKVTGLRVAGDEGSEVFRGDHYIGSMPLSLGVWMMDPPAPEPVRQAAAALKHRDFLTVCLIVEGEDLFPDNWIYIHEPGVQMGRLQNFGNWSSAMVPEKGRSSLGAEFFCNRGEELWEMSDQELIELTRRELDMLGLVSPHKVVDGVVYRRPNAYPVYDGDYKVHLRVLEEFFRSFENLQMVGRSGLHKYNNQDHSMLTAILAAENILGADHDIWAVNSDDEYHEEMEAESDRQGAHEN